MEDKKNDIYNHGKVLFSLKGFKNTNVSDITKMVGIAVGTFYNYYPSKEKLFMEIYINENIELKNSIMKSLDVDDDPAEIVKKVISLNLNGMNTNPILKEWYNRDLFHKLEKEFYQEGGMEGVFELMNSSTSELIKKWKSDKKIRNDIDTDLILSLFNSIPFIEIHKAEIGIQYFPKIIDYLVEFIMKGLTDIPKKLD